MDHYARMKFPMYSTVYFSTITGTVTGWSTNGDMGEATTYCYQLNNGGDLVQETDLSSTPLATTLATPDSAPASATASAAAETPASAPAAEAPAASAPASAPAETPASSAETPAETN
jgi:hypothetical protein